VNAEVPVIAIDGPSGAGKGTVARMLSSSLGWHSLDSGALYRATARACRRDGVDLEDEAGVAEVARCLDLRFERARDGELLVFRGDADVSDEIRTEESGRDASAVSAMPPVREALLERQRRFRRPPGLVADGRDMGTVVFPDAPLKFYLTASPGERARRRHEQLKGMGQSVNLARLLRDIRERDGRDGSRAVSPLLPADDAIVIDGTAMSIDTVFAMVMEEVGARSGTWASIGSDPG